MNKICFVIAPIGDTGSELRKRSDQVLKHVIEPATKECGYEPIRADQISKPGLITNQIIQHIRDDPLVIADLTDHNPNVFYELALRHATGKPLIQITEKGKPLPFDVAGIRTIFLDHHDLDSVEETKKEIVLQIRALESDSMSGENSLWAAINLPISLLGVGVKLAEPALLYQRHRKHASEDIFWRAFGLNRDVTMLTIKSLHTRNQLKEKIENGEVSVNSLRILTLNPELPDSLFEALSKQINEPLVNCRTDCQEAYQIFRELELKYKFVKVRRYDSLPTLQGILVNGDYALIELLTYQSNPDERTALMVSQNSPNSLKLLAQRFEKLWQDAKP